MGRRHNKKEGRSGAHPHLFRAPDVPEFRHRATYQPPRYSPLLCIAWGAALFITIIRFVQGIRPPIYDWHYIVDGLTGLALLLVTSFLWTAWEREECYPQLLPKKEFERRYPPGSAAPPSPTREFHRRIPYIEDVTATGSVVSGQKLDPRAQQMRPMKSLPPTPPATGSTIKYNARDCCDTRANQPHREGCEVFLQYPRVHSEPMLPRTEPGEDRCD